MNLVNFIDSAIKLIQRGVVDRKSFFRHPVLATKDAQNIFQRVVVMREFDFKEKSVAKAQCFYAKTMKNSVELYDVQKRA